MKKMVLVLVLLAILALAVPALLAGAPVNVRTQASAMTCNWVFEAAVRIGPSTGTALAGELNVEIAAEGDFTGTLAMADNKSLNAVGQVMGRSISVGFELQAPTSDKKGMYIFGTGTAWNKISPETECGGVLGGTFAGPQPGDIGDWIGCVKGGIKGASLITVDFSSKPNYGSAAC